MLPEYIKNNCHELRSVTDTDFTDLQPLKEILRNVRLVALGESTHGTKEFFQLKHRVFRFLVEEMGFRAFIIEAGMIPCMNINDYVRHGKGDRAKALASQGYWTWDTEEVTAMIEWMREYNLNCPRGEEVSFYGIDVKPVPEATQILRRIINKAQLSESAKLCEVLDEVFILDDEKKGDGQKCRDDSLWLMGSLKANELTICRSCGQEEYDLAIACARTMLQYLDSMVLSESMAARDILMADNTIRLLNSLPENEKAVLWAHNYHISACQSYPDTPCLGQILREKLGDRYFPFALTFGKGSFQSRSLEEGNVLGDLQEFAIDGPLKGTWEVDLNEIDHSYYFDLREAVKKDRATFEWAGNCAQLFGAGGIYVPATDPDQEANFDCGYILKNGFDGVFFVQNTTRAVPTPTGMRHKNQRSR